MIGQYQWLVPASIEETAATSRPRICGNRSLLALSCKQPVGLSSLSGHAQAVYFVCLGALLMSIRMSLSSVDSQLCLLDDSRVGWFVVTPQGTTTW